MSRHRRSEGKKGGGRAENNKIYAHPLPLGFSQYYVALGLSRPIVLNPCCEGYWEPLTRSVWVTNPKDSAILWQRGFFGKGNLSRSEPSWISRQTNARKAALSGKGIPFFGVETTQFVLTSFLSYLGGDNRETQRTEEVVQDGQSQCHCCSCSRGRGGFSVRENGYESNPDPIGCHLEAC